VTRRPVGITVYGCEPDEADLFIGLSPRFGVTPTITGATVSETSVVSGAGNRCISVSHRSSISAPTLRALQDAGVQHISTRSIGFDHIDVATARELGITVENVGYSPDGVADYTVMLMLMVLRNAKTIVSAAQRHDFRLDDVRGKELRDLTVGVVGVGPIGRAVITRLQGFGCHVLACSNGGENTAEADHVSSDELLRRSDIVTLHLPLDAHTHHFIGRQQVEAMKPGALLVNTARGALVDTAVLTEALESRRLGGAALDVLEGEEGIFYVDCTEKAIGNQLLSRLQQLPNVIVTPHTAYYTARALYETVERTLASCLRFESRCRGA
jgi:D-specific alpha-keto acid dehydrogenase